MSETAKHSTSRSADRPVRVWDLPTRVFHWCLLLLVVFSFVSIRIAGNWVQWHFYSGYAILTLIAFRLVWGFAGGRYARFGTFLFGPGAVLRYLRGAPDAPRTLGHNPIGSGSVFAMLGLIGLQAVGGLFANDDIASEGPLAKFVSKATSDSITGLHQLNQWIILALVVLHVGAILFYLFRKRENLIRPMLDGDKAANDAGLASPDDAALRLRAAVILAICAGAVWAVVHWPAK